MNNFELQQKVIDKFSTKVNDKVSKAFREDLLILLGESFNEVLDSPRMEIKITMPGFSKPYGY